MDASKRSPFQRALTTILAVVLVLGLTPSGAWAAMATDSGGGETPQAELALNTSATALQEQAEGDWTGRGTEADPYVISDAAGLFKLAENVNATTGVKYNGEYFKLGADIDLAGAEWTPIGYTNANGSGSTTTASIFAGTFDGDGHTIKGLKISAPKSTGSGTCASYALFGNARGTFKNFTVQGEITIGADYAQNWLMVAGVVGIGYSNNEFVNVGNEVNITQTSGSNYTYVGGIMARTGSAYTMTGCYNKGNISSAMGLVGGLVGQYSASNEATYTACYNAGNLALTTSNTVGTTSNAIGGLMGITGSYSRPFKGCFNYGEISYVYGSSLADGGDQAGIGAIVGSETMSNSSSSAVYFLENKLVRKATDGTSKTVDDHAAGRQNSSYGSWPAFGSASAINAAAFKSADTVTALNAAASTVNPEKGAFKAGPEYPVLYWEASGAPTITAQPESDIYQQNATAAALAVTATLPAAGEAGADGTLSYQWFKDGEAIEGATSASYTPSTAELGVSEYYCVVTNTFTVDGATLAPTATSDVAIINVQDANEASTPVVAMTLAETAGQAEEVNATVAVSGLTYTDGTVAYKLEQAGKDVEGTAEVDKVAGTASFTVPVDTYTLGANEVKITVTNTYQLTKTAEGTDTKTITISGKTVATADELADFAAQVNAGDSFENRTVTITTDIDMTTLTEGKVFAPIGTSSNPFKGEIAGGSHTISGLAIADEAYAALVGYADGAKIHDLEVAGAVSGTSYAAGIVAYAANTTVANVANHATVTQSGTSGAAGIAGFMRGSSSVTASYNDAAITGKGNVGGIIGSADKAVVTDCYNTGAVTFAGAASDLGYNNGCAGIIGRTASSGVTITNAYNAGAVTVPEGATRSFGAIAYTQDTASTPDSPACTNVFYLEGTSAVSVGRNAYNGYDGTELYAATVKPLTTATLPNAFTTLGANWQQAPTNYHDGYPALSWETVPAAALVTFTLTAPVKNLHLSTVVEGKTVLPAAQADGTYTALLPAGTYTYTAEAFGYATQTGEFAVAAEPVAVTIPAFTESAKQAVTFTVSNAAGEAIANPTIVVKNAEGTAMEAAEGAYSLPDGTYTYTVSAKGYVAKTDTFAVAGAPAAQAVTLEALPAEWDGELVSEPAQEEGVYQISHASELAWLAQQVNAGALTAPVSAVLTADVDLNGKAWTPIGATDKPFVGTFDGKGHAVKGLSIESPTSYNGVFGFVGNVSTPSMLKGIVVSGAIVATGNNASGGIAGVILNTAIEECGSSVSLSKMPDSNQGAGGIVGRVIDGGTSSITACAYIGEINGNAGSSYDDGKTIGGIVGYNAASGLVIDSCYSTGISEHFYQITGGVLGQAGAATKIQNTYSLHYFKKSGTNTGMLVGQPGSNCTFENCYYAVPNGSAVTAAITSNSTADPSGVVKLDTEGALATVSLGDKFVSKPWVNDGIPTLAWEKTENAAKISFTVTDAPADTAIELVKGGDDPIAVEKQADGTFAAYIVASAQGEYAYTAKAFGYETKTGTVTVAAVDQTIELGAFVPAAKQTVTFVVASAEEGATLENLAIVVTSELGNTVEAAEGGTYSLPAGKYTYKVSARKHLPATGEFTVADEALTQSVTLQAVPAWDGEMTLEPALVDGVFQVGNAQELAFVAALVNAAGNAVDINVVLTDDIDLNGKAWTPIGKNSTNSYRGTFDGAGHMVSGLYIPDTYNGAYVGLFGEAGVYVNYSTSYPSTIKNLTVKGSVSAATSLNEVDMGGIAGKIVATKLINCGNEATIAYAQGSGTTYLGGLVGYVDGSGMQSITGCYNAASVSATGAVTPNNMGVGGLIGTNRKSSLPISDCYNTGTVTAPKRAGGIIGFSYYGFNMENCYATGKVMCSDYAGVLSGDDDGNRCTFANCYVFVPEDSGCQNVYDGSTTVPSGVMKVDAAIDITADKLGASFKADRVFLDATPLLTWQPKTGEPLALDAEGLQVSVADVIGLDAEPVVTATYNGKEFVLGDDQVALTYYTDDTYTEVASGAENGTNYVKIEAAADGDFAGAVNATFKKALTKYKPLTGTVYLTVVDNGQWAKSADGATTMVHVPLDLAAVSAVDLDEAGLGKFNLPAADGAAYLYESTWLQAFVYVHQQFKSADDMAFAGALRGLSTNMFWGLDTRGGGDYGAGDRDIHYLFNGNPVVDEVLTEQEGKTIQATADAILLVDGDSCDVGMFTNSNSFYLYSMDPNGTYWWFYDGDAEDAAITYDYETIAGANTALNLRRTLIQVGAAGLVPSVYANEDMTVNYGTVLGTSEGTATTDEDGNLAIAFPAAGTYYVWMDANVLSEDNDFYDYADDEDEIISTPAYAKVTVKSMDEALAELREAITAAGKTKVGIEISADGEDVTIDKQWVTQEIADALNDAIVAAVGVVTNSIATPDEVAAASKALNETFATYVDAIAYGTRPLATDAEKAEAERQIYNAERALDGVMMSEDGSDVAEGAKWAPAETVNAVRDAIAAAKETLAQPSLPEDVLADAVDALAAVTAALNDAVRTDPIPEYKQLDGVVYVNVSYDGKFVNSMFGTPMASIPVDLAEASQVDLDEYGCEAFKKAAADDADYKFEPSLLQIAIYLHEQYFEGGADAGFATSESPYVPGTASVDKFWGIEGRMLAYNVNAEMGMSTLDGIYPASGDVYDFNIFAGPYYGDTNAGNLYFYDSADSAYNDVADQFEASVDEPATFNIRKVVSEWVSEATEEDPWAGHSEYAAKPVEGLTVSYGTVYGTALGTATADAQGNVQITFPAEGAYVVWADGIQGAGEGVDYAVTSPALAKVDVTVDDRDEYKQLEGTVYVSVSYDGKFAEDADGAPMAFVPVDLAEASQIDLDEYGCSAFKKAAGEDADYKYEASLLQIAIYLHENYFADGVEGLATSESTYVPGTASIDKFWGIDGRMLSYNVNAEMGMNTLDGIYPVDGDMYDFDIYAGPYYYDANAGSLYFYDSADATYDDVENVFTAESGEPVALNIRKVASTWVSDATEEDPWAGHSEYAAVPVEGLVVSYGTVYGEALGTATADAQGNVQIELPADGTYFVWADGLMASGEDANYAVTSPAFAKVIAGASAADDEDVKQLARDIRNAERLLATIASSADGSDVTDDELWAPDEEIEALEAAIAAAKAVANDPNATAAQVADAAKALAAAKAELADAAEEGAKASESTISELEDAIAEAEAVATDGASDAAKKALADAIAAAKALADDPDATAEDVAAAIEAMESAAETAETEAAAAKKAAADAAAAKAVTDAIAALPAAGKVTAADAAKADAAKAAYDKLTADQKKLVDAASVTKLNNVKKATDAAKKAAADEAKNGLAKGKTFTVKTKQGTFTYKVTAKKTVTLTKATKTKKNGTVTVNTVKYNGVTYKVTAVGTKAFKSSKLKKVTLGANVKKVGKQAFVNSKLLKTFTVGKNVTKINANAFKNAKKLTKLTVKSSKLNKKSTVKNALKSSKVKTVKLSSMTKAQKKKVIKAFAAAGKKKVTVK